jgi:tetratricopeptide (TPR) repeat protein
MKRTIKRLITLPILLLTQAYLAIDRWQVRTLGTRSGAVRLAHLASLEIERGNWEYAIFLADRAVCTDPRLANGYRQLGFAQSRAGDIVGARHTYERALCALPADPQLAIDLGGFELEQGRDMAAVAAYGRALLLRPQDVVVLRQLGLALLNQQRADEASTLLELALALVPGDAQALMSLGRARYQQGNLSDARHLLSESIERERGDPNAHYSLAQVLAASDRFPEGLDAIQRAIRLDPKNQRFRELQGALRKAVNPFSTSDDDLGHSS